MTPISSISSAASAVVPSAAGALPVNPADASAQITQSAQATEGANVAGMYFSPRAAETIPFYTTNANLPKGDLANILTTAVPGPADASNPMQVLAVQMTLLQTTLSWELSSKVAGQIDSGIQSLFNSQV
jgi:hypothetical protein